MNESLPDIVLIRFVLEKRDKFRAFWNKVRLTGAKMFQKNPLFFKGYSRFCNKCALFDPNSRQCNIFTSALLRTYYTL